MVNSSLLLLIKLDPIAVSTLVNFYLFGVDNFSHSEQLDPIVFVNSSFYVYLFGVDNFNHSEQLDPIDCINSSLYLSVWGWLY